MFHECPIGTLPTKKQWDYAIKLKSDFMNKKRWIIPISQNELKEINEFLKENLAKDFI